jgi:hypothetical protein
VAASTNLLSQPAVIATDILNRRWAPSMRPLKS